jgi:hypothetical protein
MMAIPPFYANFIFIFTSLILLLSGRVLSSDALIEIRDSKVKVFSENIKFFSPSIKNMDLNDEVMSISGKFCLKNSTDGILNECMIKYENYNAQWVKY